MVGPGGVRAHIQKPKRIPIFKAMWVIAQTGSQLRTRMMSLFQTFSGVGEVIDLNHDSQECFAVEVHVSGEMDEREAFFEFCQGQVYNKHVGTRRYLKRMYLCQFTCESAQGILQLTSSENQKDSNVQPVFLIQGFPQASMQKELAAYLDSQKILVNPHEFSHVLTVFTFTKRNLLDFTGSADLQRFSGVFQPDLIYIGSISIQPYDCQTSRSLFVPRPVSTRNDGKRCRAWFKVEELLSLGLITGSPKLVVDVGASPGGWSEKLAEISEQVVAIDPGMLDEAVLSIPNVTHLQCKVQDKGVMEYLKGREIQLLLCDMNVQAEEGLEMIKELFSLMPRKSTLVFTVKLMKRYSSRALDSIMQRCRNVLSEHALEETEMRWLFSNTACERTIVARKL